MRKNIQQIRTDHQDYFRIAISVDCVILGYEEQELKVLLIQSDLEEYRGMLSLLGDLVRPDEDLERAADRVLFERTGLKNVYLEQAHTFGDVHRHPAGRVITTANYSLINIHDHQLRLSDHQLQWHAVSGITRLAFDHKKILDTCLALLRSKIMQQPLVFNLLPQKFSLRELQNVYESVLGTPLDRRNFRKRFFQLDWLEDVDELEQEVRHRPGKLYRFKRP